MGIISNQKDFFKTQHEKAINHIASNSALSSSQIENVNEKRNYYLSQKPKTGEENNKNVERRLGAVAVEVYQAYLEQLDSVYLPVERNFDNFDEYNRIRFFDITKWVTDSEEQNLDKLVNVYQALSSEKCNIALIYNRTVNGTKVTIGVVNNDADQSDPSIADKYNARMVEALRGNFPGVEIDEESLEYNVGIPDCLVGLNEGDEGNYAKSVAIVSNIASEKSEKFISQSMEKLLDGIAPSDNSQEYTIVLLAQPLYDQLERKNQLYELYSELSSYATWQSGYTFTQSDSEGSTASGSTNVGVNVGVHAGAGFMSPVNTGIDAGTNFGASFVRASSITTQVGEAENVNQTFVNYAVKHTLDIIESQVKRMEESSALGMWDFAAYIVSESPVIANNVSHMYMALTQGDESFMSNASINFWDGELETDTARVILDSVKRLQHPVFGLKTSLDDEWLMYPTLVSPTTPLSGKELAKALNFPRKSVCGFPVLKVASFGRNIVTYDNKNNVPSFHLGHIFHMNHEEKTEVRIDKKSLCSHVFITGSTGSGKSNTVYQIISEAKKQGVRFMIVEPAKGEYKDVFGNDKDVMVYGTNPDISSLLKLNPFSFPKGITVYEHMDRLVEIFNVCWPMYAAMPAVLKNAIEQSYIDCGWNLSDSTNKYGSLYPNFADVARNIKLIIDSSEYDAENKGAYKGSLLTRLTSLSNGINGQIFSENEISANELFDQNVIIDLSRVGSSETKSLIMSMLVLKLQEYRMVSNNDHDSDLNHLTVLEEAHNILKRTSAEQPIEGGNLLGRSVEMLANAIAEMRSYGEGFIIADQAPGLLDMSVIRNTNTKIIMRLPDQSDRELVGRAANLNDDQIAELAKLPCGVAAIYQNDWVEPVLCKVENFYESNKREKYSYIRHEKSDEANAYGSSFKIAELLSKGVSVDKKHVFKVISKELDDMNINASTRVTIFKMLLNPPKEPRMLKLGPVMAKLFPTVAEVASEVCNDETDYREWTTCVENELTRFINKDTEDRVIKDIVQAIITYQLIIVDGNEQAFQDWGHKGGLLS